MGKKNLIFKYTSEFILVWIFLLLIDKSKINKDFNIKIIKPDNAVTYFIHIINFVWNVIYFTCAVCCKLNTTQNTNYIVSCV